FVIEGNKISAVKIDISSALDSRKGAVAIEFYFECPVRIVERFIDKLGKHGFNSSNGFFFLRGCWHGPDYVFIGFFFSWGRSFLRESSLRNLYNHRDDLRHAWQAAYRQDSSKDLSALPSF